MTAIAEFIQNNIWLCIGIGVVLVIVGDEVLGVSRSIFGDDDDYPKDPGPPPPAELDPWAEDQTEESKGSTIDDLLTPPRK